MTRPHFDGPAGRVPDLERRLARLEAMQQRWAVTSDSDSDGTWVLVGGLLVCRHTLLVNGTSGSTWTFPRTFGANPQVVASPLTGTSRFVVVTSRGTTSATFDLYDDTGGNPPNTNVMTFAIGTPA